MDINDILAVLLVATGLLLLGLAIASIIHLKPKIWASVLLLVFPLFLIVSGFYTNELGLPSESSSSQKSSVTDNNQLIDRGRMTETEVAQQGLVLTTKGEQEIRFTVKNKYKFEIIDEQIFETVRIPHGRSSHTKTVLKDIHYMKDPDGKVFPAKILTQDGNSSITVVVLNAESMKAMKAAREQSQL